MSIAHPGRRGPTCRACAHPKSAEVAAALAQGETLQSIGNRFGLSVSGLSRHATNCLKISIEEGKAARKMWRKPAPPPPPLPAAITGQVIVDAVLPTRENLIGRLERLSERVDELAVAAKDEGRDGVALAGLSEIRKTISDIGRIAGIDRPSVAVQVNNINAPAADDIARTVLDLLRQELPPERRVTLLPALATRLKSIS